MSSQLLEVPLKPPFSFFETPEPDQPTPMTYEDDGAVYGHLALWDSCHRGFMNGSYSECVKAPRSQTNYNQFYAGGSLQTAEGPYLDVGRLTFDTTHAPIGLGLQAATTHYSNSGNVGAFVRATDGNLGIWLSGVIRSGISPEAVRDMRANPPSGDWRLFRSGDLELIASLSVPVPGLPIMRSQLALAASADGGLEVSALILTGPTFEDFEEGLVASYTSAQKRKKKMLSGRALTAAVLTTERRNSLPESAFALSGRRYPIHDLAHARNALARSAGKAEEGAVRRAVCKRYPALCK
jgi:hypothetical protein